MRKNRIVLSLAGAGLVVASAIGTAGSAAATTATPDQASPSCNYTNSEPTLSRGSSGTAVKQLQCELNLSLSPSSHTPLNIDGSFGPATQTAVYQFQSCAGLSVDGIVGPNTWGSLDYWYQSPNYVC
ncbi:peptidoglycan-binding domain-containing protein [Kitasatospora cathayae]|uniref:Peptidoglycan-binding domain-containing protein n=1 Tax=Kitasatospora cathayae TaxID=3004092 RepID=A0ABY7Q588_9ACTN|nr:peptidoglycan-binding domain-containing protein [Kitasatospora sp. HUAS 3-15]WBP87776.1 peptidoglycan-binding domain-containing protein [Kitasatospora sp. HUAS 3-15]